MALFSTSWTETTWSRFFIINSWKLLSADSIEVLVELPIGVDEACGGLSSTKPHIGCHFFPVGTAVGFSPINKHSSHLHVAGFATAVVVDISLLQGDLDGFTGPAYKYGVRWLVANTWQLFACFLDIQLKLLKRSKSIEMIAEPL